MNEEMAERLANATSVAEVQAIANSYGYELTVEQAQEVFDKIQSLTVSDGELSDDMLEAVTGGGIIATVEEWFTVALPALFR